MSDTLFIDKLMPGFAQAGFGQQLNALMLATNVAAVRAHLASLIPKLTADGVTGITATASAANLITSWNLLCDQLNAAAAITLKDYANCKVTRLTDFGVKWKQMMVALDREAAMDKDYVAMFGHCCVPWSFQ